MKTNYTLFTPEQIKEKHGNIRHFEYMEQIYNLHSDCMIRGFVYIPDHEQATYLGGAFAEHYGFLKVNKSNGMLLTQEELVVSNYNWQLKLMKQYPDIYNDRIILEDHLIMPSVERPYVMYFCGNDDFSWTKTVKDEEDIHKNISDLCFKCESLGKHEYYTFNDMIKEMKFIFTN